MMELPPPQCTKARSAEEAVKILKEVIQKFEEQNSRAAALQAANADKANQRVTAAKEATKAKEQAKRDAKSGLATAQDRTRGQGCGF